MRVSPEAELEGLDMPEFGAKCYPDFVLVGAAPGTHGLESDEDSGRGPGHEEVGAEPRATPL